MHDSAVRLPALNGPSNAPSVPFPYVSPEAWSPFKTGGRRSESEISWTFNERIEPGDYPAFSRSSAVYRDKQFKRWVCAVQFDILSESLMEVVARLTWYLNLGTREKPHAGRRGNYWTAWVTANGGSPKRRDRLSHHVFGARHARVKVEDTTKNHRQQQVEVEEAYSVIRDVLRWETGRPQQ